MQNDQESTIIRPARLSVFFCDSLSLPMNSQTQTRITKRKINQTMCTMTRKPSIGLVKVRKTVKAQRKTKTTRPERRTVRFASKEEVAFRHVTREELTKVWYSDRDYDSFKLDCKRTARDYAVAGGDVTRLDPMKVCLRGLEQNLTRASILTRKMTITTSIRVVLGEQKDQKRMGEIARVVSEAARNRAITVASFDAKLAKL